jgi:hypothetical protein
MQRFIGTVVLMLSAVVARADSRFIGAPDAPSSEGKHFSKAEQPFAFMGRLNSGGENCDESSAITFRNVKSLGITPGKCEYKISHADKDGLTELRAICSVKLEGLPATVLSNVLTISDQTSTSRDGRKLIREAMYMRAILLAGDQEPTLLCQYSGYVFERD